MNQFLALLDKSTKIAFGVALAGAILMFFDPASVNWALYPTLIAACILLYSVAKGFWIGIAWLSSWLWHWGWRRAAIFRLGNVTSRHRLLLLWLSSNPKESISGSRRKEDENLDELRKYAEPEKALEVPQALPTLNSVPAGRLAR